MSDLLIRTLGWPATILHGDPCVTDRFLWVRHWLQPGARRTLDAGAGNGGFAIYAARKGNSTLALSFSGAEMRAAERRATLLGASRLEFRIGDLRELDRFAHEIGTFDQILCLEVAEHIRNDGKLIADLAACLRPGGRLLLTAPSKSHHALWRERVSESEDGGHVRWGYDPAEMQELLEAGGLRVVAQEHVSGIISQQLTNLMRILQSFHRVVGWTVVLPLRPLQVLDRPLTRALRYPSLSIAVVAERPR